MQQLTLRLCWCELLPNDLNDEEGSVTDKVKDNANEFSNIFSMLPGFENCRKTDRFNFDMEDAGFQLLRDDEIIKAWHFPKIEEKNYYDETNYCHTKINNNNAFECLTSRLFRNFDYLM